MPLLYLSSMIKPRIKRIKEKLSLRAFSEILWAIFAPSGATRKLLPAMNRNASYCRKPTACEPLSAMS